MLAGGGGEEGGRCHRPTTAGEQPSSQLVVHNVGRHHRPGRGGASAFRGGRPLSMVSYAVGTGAL